MDNVKYSNASETLEILDVRMRSESSTLPCLLRTGLVGQPTSHKGRRERYHLKKIFKEAYTTLLLAHQHGRAHLSVRPSKIIASGDPSANGLRAMLLGWECAHPCDDEVNGVVGYPAFARDGRAYGSLV